MSGAGRGLGRIAARLRAGHGLPVYSPFCRDGAFVVLFMATGRIGPGQMRALLAALHDEQRARAAQFQRPADRRDYVAAHGLMALTARRAGLGEARLRQPAPGAKPRLHLRSTAPAPDASLSHCRGAVAVALCWQGRIGVDVEPCLREDIVRGAALFCAPAELRAGSRLIGQAVPRHFVRLWTLKEAILKATGAGLSQDPRGIIPDLGHGLPEAEPALARGGPGWELRHCPAGADHALSMAVLRGPETGAAGLRQGARAAVAACGA
ncbi:4'-phosphopantetheinyl transferase superfamily protein [Salipiger sp. P9]|uniref:4'-phosphopantetheinyl transferase family protein n=1 Tax=Salipiger pentaromativorans TaxID=2943193 RepID=UPI0021584C2C|nr:4'-phosphopantetheinyl transferase superfamily protein [Salipiger pentaromativorans]MCR8547593.1 4'-phosphopantetheinyl transferase superfamily protein [Salipiger pentaromativorans]